MKNTDEFIIEIRQLIAQAKTAKALDVLKEMADTLDITALMNEHASLSSRYYRTVNDDLKGIISSTDRSLVINTINHLILELLDNYKKGNLVEAVNPDGTESGRIIHNIPSQMVPLKSVLCSVRIAKDDEILLKDFPMSDNSQPESLDISGNMTVELVDPYGGEIFEIARIPPGTSIQRIERGKFTEWDFRIKPLQQGSYTLWLYASTIIGDKPKQVRFFKNIEISTDTVDTGQTWQATDGVLQGAGHSERKNRSVVGGWFSTISATTKALLLILAASVLGLLGYQLLRQQKPPIEEVPKVQPVLKIDSRLLVETVEVNGQPVAGWMTNSDTSEITLPEYAVEEEYAFSIKGRNGQCEKKSTLSKEAFLIQMDCAIIPDKVQPRLSIDNRLKVQSISVDGSPVSTWTANADTTEILLPALEIDKVYTFQIKGANGKCGDTATVRKDNPVIQLGCSIDQVVEERYRAKLRIQRSLVQGLDYTKLMVRTEPSGRETGNPEIEGEYVVFKVRNLKPGNYRFKLNGLDNAIVCSTLSTTITDRDQTLNFDCALNTFSVWLKVPINSNNGWSKLRITMDGGVRTERPIDNGGGFAVFTLRNVPYGQHTFKVHNYNASYICDSIGVRVNALTVKEFNCLVDGSGIK